MRLFGSDHEKGLHDINYVLPVLLDLVGLKRMRGGFSKVH
jgi:hypothetical protein